MQQRFEVIIEGDTQLTEHELETGIKAALRMKGGANQTSKVIVAFDTPFEAEKGT